MQTTIKHFVIALNSKWPKTYSFFDVIEGNKYWKIVIRDKPDDDGKPRLGCSAYAFVDKKTGDLYKAASWNAPAKKHIRGNINDQTGLDACLEYGVKYLR